MKKAITPFTFITSLITGLFVNNLIIEKMSITNFFDQVLCTFLIAIIFSTLAASFKVDIPK
jgi:hypothetical protein